jgi:hypothetical protein
MSGFWLLFIDELRHLSRVRFLVWIAVLIILILVAVVLFNAGSEEKIPFDFVFIQLSFMANLATGSVLTSTLTNDINNKTLLPILARPVTSFSILFSRAAALVTSIFAVIAFALLIMKIVSHVFNFSIAAAIEFSLSYLYSTLLVQLICNACLGLIIGTFVTSPATGQVAFVFICIPMLVLLYMVGSPITNLLGLNLGLFLMIITSLLIMFIALTILSKYLKIQVSK